MNVQASEQFSQSVALIKNATPDEAATAATATQGTPLLPRDMLMKASFGTLMSWHTKNGTLVQGVRVARYEPSAFLDQIDDTIGAILLRTPAGWMSLKPLATGKVLTDNGPGEDPSWQDASSGGSTQTEFGEIQGIGPTGTWGSTGYFSGRLLFPPANATIASLKIVCTGATASAVVRPGIFAVDSSLVPSTKLADGSPVTGTTIGVNKLDFTTPYAMLKGTPIFFGIQVETAAIQAAVAGGSLNRAYFSNTGSLPSTAPSVSWATNTWPTFWLSTDT